MSTQISSIKRAALLQSVLTCLADADTINHQGLYQRVATQLGIEDAELNAREPIGKSGKMHSPVQRAIRWCLQSARNNGLAERVERGVWRITQEGRSKIPLRKMDRGHVLVGFSTDLGIAVWGKCQTVFESLDEPIEAIITSPPYPLRNPRAYGNVAEKEYVDFICEALAPVIARLSPSGSLVLNLTNDVFLPNSPARSTYRERLTLELCDRFGLSLMDTHPWLNRSKPPGPVQWASKTRQQLNTAWEPVMWFARDPKRVNADNRRVLQPHSERHKRFLAQGGERRDASYSDGAYTLRRGKSFGRMTEGKIPRNILEFGHVCGSLRTYRERARAAGLPVHGAPYNLKLAEFYIRFLTAPNDLVADPFSGIMTTCLAAQLLGRRWIASEDVLEFILGGGLRFLEIESLRFNKELWDAAA